MLFVFKVVSQTIDSLPANSFFNTIADLDSDIDVRFILNRKIRKIAGVYILMKNYSPFSFWKPLTDVGYEFMNFWIKSIKIF